MIRTRQARADASSAPNAHEAVAVPGLFKEHMVTKGLIVNAPAVFERPDFMAWLDDPARRVFTWHDKGFEATEGSDVVVLVGADYDGDCSDMPEDLWKAICDLVYDTFPGSRRDLDPTVPVRLTNIADD